MVANLKLKPRMTVLDYLKWEANNEIKHEYIDGNVYAMAGGTDKHSHISANAIGALINALYNSICSVRTNDLKVKAGEKRYLYPDMSVVCGRAILEDGSTTLLNPILVVEVTSPSSIHYDRGEKRDFYRDVPSIQAYLIIDQHRVCAELYTRAEVGWRRQVFTNRSDVISLPMLSCELSLDDIYRDITIDSAQMD